MYELTGVLMDLSVGDKAIEGTKCKGTAPGHDWTDM